MGNIVSTSIFDDLKQQVFDKRRWDKTTFKVFSYEAGLGKSLTTQQFLAEAEDRALYVQRFVKDGALDETVERINEIAGTKVAVRLAEDEIKSGKARKGAINARVLCITHQLYYSICKGNHQDLIADRSILVIDEYPDLLEQITVADREIGQLWATFYQYGLKETDELASLFRDLIRDYSYSFEIQKNKEMIFVHFNEEKYDKYKEVIDRLFKKADQIKKAEHKELLFKFQQLLHNGGYFYEYAFHTVDTTPKFAMLDCNIILDANAEQDYRYALSNKFQVIKQPKVFDNSNAVFYHYDVNTSKKALKGYKNLIEKALEQIDLKGSTGILFITEKSQKEKVEKEIEGYFNKTLKEVQEAWGYPVTVDYFGNLIGKNCYRNYNTVIMLKTPNFSYESYTLSNFLYSSMENLPIGNISIFQDETVEKIRISTTAGEMYQAIRRIARSNTGDARIYVFNNNQDVIDMVLEQLPGIQYQKSQMDVEKVGREEGGKEKVIKEKKMTKFDMTVEKVKAILTNLKQSNIKEIQKEQVRVEAGVKDKSNFSKLLIALKPFLETNQIDKDTNKQRFIFR
ncbi:hypothetical protein HPT25_03675 [Bacillus sp. BRMEA1]|uniref:hypothetical protein n=1 Tax=Neobacillus endophyticus TaxID=2738405 RepID=UPI001565CC3B|nr:hypothetical protein [Neobacillus endophyticus]NRD76590.1 hypothetical protein [Neobacillus endophyticus]